MKLGGLKKSVETEDIEEIAEAPKDGRKVINCDTTKDNVGTGPWWDGVVQFLSQTERIVVPVKCKATNIYGAISRAPRVGKKGMPKAVRKGNAKRITKVLVEINERR
jgi:hypothetical protein